MRRRWWIPRPLDTLKWPSPLLKVVFFSVHSLSPLIRKIASHRAIIHPPMGAACCHSTRFNDPLLSLSASAMSVEMHHFYTPLTATSLSSPPSLSSSSSSARQSLANYVSFPFPFVVEPTTTTGTQTGHTNKKSKRKNKRMKTIQKRNKKQKGHETKAVATPYMGEHCRQTTRGTFVPLTLFELSVRYVCAQLVVHQHKILRAATLPPEVASKVLQWLRQHHILDKSKFHALAPFLLVAWNLANHQEVEDSWFDGIPATTLAQAKSIDVSGCVYLHHVGSEKGRVQLPQLVTASFQGCSSLSTESVQLLTFSTKLTALNLSGCVNVDDESVRALSASIHLRSLQLVGGV